MYDLSRYDNLFPPAAWLVVIALVFLLNSHLMVLYFELQIHHAIRQARKHCQNLDTDYVAHDERHACARWKACRRLSWSTVVLGSIGWVISL